MHFQLSAIAPIKNDVIKSLSLYYYTFVDLLDFRDNVCELLTTMDACQLHLDIVRLQFLYITHKLFLILRVNTLQTVNFELTKAYLDLVSTYVTLMIMLSRVEDRKAVLGLYSAAYELLHSQRLVMGKL